MVFIGYEIGTKAYRCFDPVNTSLHISRDVVYEEGTKLDWSNQKERVWTLTFMPELCVKSTVEDHISSGEDIEAERMENDDEELASRSSLWNPSLWGTNQLLNSILRLIQCRQKGKCLILFEEPSTYREAVCEEAWNRAMKEEMEAIDRSQTWELVAPPPNWRPIGLKWIFKLKKSVKGDILMHKARPFVKGYLQR